MFERIPHTVPKAGYLAEALRRHRSSLRSDESGMSVVLTASRTLQRPAPSAFIGREKEFAELQHRLNATIAGGCQFAVVAGEPGIGKTRLLEELKKLATMRKIRSSTGASSSRTGFFVPGFMQLLQDTYRQGPGSSGASGRLFDIHRSCFRSFRF